MKKNREHVIKSIEPGSIAEELELEPGDVLVEVNGQPGPGRFGLSLSDQRRISGDRGTEARRRRMGAGDRKGI